MLTEEYLWYENQLSLWPSQLLYECAMLLLLAQFSKINSMIELAA